MRMIDVLLMVLIKLTHKQIKRLKDVTSAFPTISELALRYRFRSIIEFLCYNHKREYEARRISFAVLTISSDGLKLSYIGWSHQDSFHFDLEDEDRKRRLVLDNIDFA
jgi:hypothetical protein